VNVKVPAGVSSGNYMTMESMGNAAPNKGEPGDLIVVFEEKNHDIFTRHGNHIICEMPISFTTAAIGGTVSVPTLTGSESVKIPAGTQPGKVFKLRGKGIPNLHRNGKGDLLIRVFIWVPTEISARDREIMDELSQSNSFKPPKASKSLFEKLRETLGV